MTKIGVILIVCLFITLKGKFSIQFGENFGGFSNLNIRDKKVVEISRFAVKAYNTQVLKNSNRYSLISIHSAKSKIVSGISYQVNVNVKESSCKHVNCRKIKCIFTVVEQSWLNLTRLTNYNCL